MFLCPTKINLSKSSGSILKHFPFRLEHPLMYNFFEISQQIVLFYKAPQIPSPFCYQVLVVRGQPTLVLHMPGLNNSCSKYLASPRISTLGWSPTLQKGQMMPPRINFPLGLVLSRTGPRMRFGGEVGGILVWKPRPKMDHRGILGRFIRWTKGWCHFVADMCC